MADTAKDLQVLGKEMGLLGTLILAPEGVNTTIAGADEALARFQTTLFTSLGISKPPVKSSRADFPPFKRFKVEIRRFAVTLKDMSLAQVADGTHLSPAEWSQRALQANTRVIDTRNWYETRLGRFSGSLDLKIKDFSQFPQAIEAQKLPKDTTVLLYCTGGIRCEKAVPILKEMGFKDVYQLEGGILNHFETLKGTQFEGECFVFDKRVAVDRDLAPSVQFKLCYACGNPHHVSVSCDHKVPVS